jgi:hypothetical protein
MQSNHPINLIKYFCAITLHPTLLLKIRLILCYLSQLTDKKNPVPMRSQEQDSKLSTQFGDAEDRISKITHGVLQKPLNGQNCQTNGAAHKIKPTSIS